MADDPVEEDANLDGSSSGAEIVFAITAAFLCAILIRTISSMVPYKFRFLPIPYTGELTICMHLRHHRHLFAEIAHTYNHVILLIK